MVKALLTKSLTRAAELVDMQEQSQQSRRTRRQSQQSGQSNRPSAAAHSGSRASTFNHGTRASEFRLTADAPDGKEVDSAANRWSCQLIFRMQGSVFPRALLVAVPPVLIVVALRVLIVQNDWYIPELGGSQVWAGYNTALAFLIIFRTQKAYARWWEGGTLLQQVRGEWYNATSSLIAFCSSDSSREIEIRDFQHLMVRLMSLLYCSALQQIAMLEDDCFEILNTDGVDEDSLDYLQNSANRCEVIISWMQRLIVLNMESGVLCADPPIISRVFQEISRGFVNHNNVRKIREFPFPFPYAQMITLMLMIHWIITPVASCLIVDNLVWACVLTFITIFAFWCINYIAEEIEMPFGDDSNDLPIAHMQKQMNNSLYTLLQKGSQTPPRFVFDAKMLQDSMAFQKVASMSGMCESITFDQCWPSEGNTERRRQASLLNHIPEDSPPVFQANESKDSPPVFFSEDSRPEVRLSSMGPTLAAKSTFKSEATSRSSPSPGIAGKPAGYLSGDLELLQNVETELLLLDEGPPDHSVDPSGLHLHLSVSSVEYRSPSAPDGRTSVPDISDTHRHRNQERAAALKVWQDRADSRAGHFEITRRHNQADGTSRAADKQDRAHNSGPVVNHC